MREGAILRLFVFRPARSDAALDATLREDVLPGQYRTPEGGLPQRVAAALTVRDVEDLAGAGRQVLTAACEIGGTARAMVERVAGAAEHARQGSLPRS